MMIGLEVVGQSYVKLLLMGLHMNIWRERERKRKRERTLLCIKTLLAMQISGAFYMPGKNSKT